MVVIKLLNHKLLQGYFDLDENGSSQWISQSVTQGSADSDLGLTDETSRFLFFQPYHSQAAEARCTYTDTRGRPDSGFSSEGEGYSVFNFIGILLLVSQKPKTSGILDDKGLDYIL